MRISELKQFILDNPSVLKRPIIIDNDKLQVGYNDEEIRVFVPKRLRELIMCVNCPQGEHCDYQNILKQYFDEIKEKRQDS